MKRRAAQMVWVSRHDGRVWIYRDRRVPGQIARPLLKQLIEIYGEHHWGTIRPRRAGDQPANEADVEALVARAAEPKAVPA